MLKFHGNWTIWLHIQYSPKFYPISRYCTSNARERQRWYGRSSSYKPMQSIRVPSISGLGTSRKFNQSYQTNKHDSEKSALDWKLLSTVSKSINLSKAGGPQIASPQTWDLTNLLDLRICNLQTPYFWALKTSANLQNIIFLLTN